MIQKIIDILEKYDKILILGFGREGKTSYNFFKKHLPKKNITILDENQIGEINDKNTEVLIEKITKDRLEQFDLIIKTPGISFKGMNTEGLNITSQLELLLEVNKKNVIGITGTKGKSTTTTLLYNVIKDQKENTFLLGNIGVPIFEQIENFDENSTLVIECSSHQLQYIKTSPHIAILLNLYPEHLDHYNNLQEYYDSKLNIFKYQEKGDFAIFDEQVNCSTPLKEGQTRQIDCTNHPQNHSLNSNFSPLIINSFPVEIGKDIAIQGDFVIWNGKNIYDINSKRKLLGEHNLRNIINIFVVCEILGLDIEKAKKIISEFNPLEHRMELVGTFGGITYYNDSIATIPEATINSLKSFVGVNTLILGGMDRGIDYSELIDFLNKSDIENIICLPITGHEIMPKLHTNVYKVENLPQAVEISKRITKKGKICLLSPAAASYGYFKNFEERGTMFKNLVKG